MRLYNEPKPTLAVERDGEIEKSQGVRLLDMAVFGPLMILGALNKRPPAWMQVALLIVGAGTIIYNASNYLATEKQKRLTVSKNNAKL